MSFAFKKHYSAIGLDIGSRRIKAAQLSYEADNTRHVSEMDSSQDEYKNIEIVNTISFDQEIQATSDGVINTDRIHSILSNYGFIGHEIAIAAPFNTTKTGIITLPHISNPQSQYQLAKNEFSRSNNIDTENYFFTYWPMPCSIQQTNTQSYMAAACNQNESNQLVGQLFEAGLATTCIDLEGLAQARYFNQYGAITQGITALIDIGHHATKYVLLLHGEVIYLRTSRECSMNILFDELTKKTTYSDSTIHFLLQNFGLTKLEYSNAVSSLNKKVRPIIEKHLSHIANEINLAKNYTAHQYQQHTIDRVFVTGGGSMIQGANQYLNDLIVTSSTNQQDNENIISSASVVNNLEYSLAIGLALHGLGAA